MTTPDVSERQRKAAYKAWETIRRKREAALDPTSRSSVSSGALIQKPSPSEGRRRKAWSVQDYPANWKEIRTEILMRSADASGRHQCECRGECRKHLGGCGEINGAAAGYRRQPGKVPIRLTIAHLCHTPKCDDRTHLRAMCEPCHLIYDKRCRQRALVGEAAVAWALRHDQPWVVEANGTNQE
jgi:hypothetical protein